MSILECMRDELVIKFYDCQEVIRGGSGTKISKIWAIYFNPYNFKDKTAIL